MVLASLGDGILTAGVGAAPEAISVDFDSTFLVQLVLFVILTLVLKPLLFDPMLTLFEEREKRTDGAKAQARKIDEKSASALTQYEAAMTKARASATADRDAVRAEAHKREQEILAGVRAKATAVVDEGKRSAREEADRVRKAIPGQAQVLGEQLAELLLGREVKP